MTDAGETFEVFPFRYRDPRTGKWVKARYKATRDEIAARYAEWEVTGEGEVRRPLDAGLTLNSPIPSATAPRSNWSSGSATGPRVGQAALAACSLRKPRHWCTDPPSIGSYASQR